MIRPVVFVFGGGFLEPTGGSKRGTQNGTLVKKSPKPAVCRCCCLDPHPATVDGCEVRDRTTFKPWFQWKTKTLHWTPMGGDLRALDPSIGASGYQKGNRQIYHRPGEVPEVSISLQTLSGQARGFGARVELPKSGCLGLKARSPSALLPFLFWGEGSEPY